MLCVIFNRQRSRFEADKHVLVVFSITSSTTNGTPGRQDYLDIICIMETEIKSNTLQKSKQYNEKRQ